MVVANAKTYFQNHIYKQNIKFKTYRCGDNNDRPIIVQLTWETRNDDTKLGVYTNGKGEETETKKQG